MTSNLDRPSLVIGYSENFALDITCTRAQEYSKVGMPGVKEYFFATRVRIQHPPAISSITQMTFALTSSA
jgi:hypothetical protein